MADPRDFEQHKHDAMVHEHEHFHVTHNWSETAGTFMHLSSKHSHSHDHAEVNHAHLPHGSSTPPATGSQAAAMPRCSAPDP